MMIAENEVIEDTLYEKDESDEVFKMETKKNENYQHN